MEVGSISAQRSEGDLSTGEKPEASGLQDSNDCTLISSCHGVLIKS